MRAQAGVICGGSSRTQFQRNVVARNGGFGVAVVDAAGGLFTDNRRALTAVKQHARADYEGRL